MNELFSLGAIFILSFLGLVMIVAVIFVLWLAYRYDISFSIHTKEKTKAPDPDIKVIDEPRGAGKHGSIS